MKSINIFGFIFTFCILAALVFRVILSLFGVQYHGAEDSPLYKILVVVLDALSIGYIAFKELTDNSKARGSIFPYFIPIIVAVVYWLEEVLLPPGYGRTAQNNFLFFFSFGAPGIFIATYCYRYRQFFMIAKNLELLMLIAAFALILNLPVIIAPKLADKYAYGNHQTISYTAAVAFGVLFCSLKRDYKFPRYSIFRWKHFPVLGVTLMVMMGIMCLIGGGRGGVVLLFINLLVCTWFLARRHIGKMAVGMVVLLGAVVVLSQLNLPMFDKALDVGMKRSFAFIGANGIDMKKGSSGRDAVYSEGMRVIGQNPLTGYGVFHQYDISQAAIHQPYFHNIFIETTAQAGILWTLCIAGIMIWVTVKWVRMLRKNALFYFLIPLLTFPFIQLQFSTTYLISAPFWFIVVFVLGYDRQGAGKGKSVAVLSKNTNKPMLG